MKSYLALERAARLVAISLLLSTAIHSCATVPYVRGQNIETASTVPLRPGEPQIERGRPQPFLDGVGHYLFSLPTKVLLWNWKLANHSISEKTEEKLRKYLSDNDLRHVKVRINQYNPGDEWERLFHNRAVSPFWRYTVGALTVGFYTIFPERIFAGLLGGDNYNPFTNSINLYSDVESVALHEAAHAKDVAGREYKGTYGALRLLPIVPLFQEATATGDAIGYDRANGMTESEKADYKVLYPAFMTYIAGEGLRWVTTPWAFPVMLAATVPGHVVGRMKANSVEDERNSETLPAMPVCTKMASEICPSLPNVSRTHGGAVDYERDFLSTLLPPLVISPDQE